MRALRSIPVVLGLGLAAASGAHGQGTGPQRGTKVVPERPARVFVMAGFDNDCRALKPVTITIDRPPAQGTVSLRENQDTTIQFSLSGKCIGSRISGTGIYYTARVGAVGTDTFSVTARLGNETASRTFTVAIADE